MYNFVCFMTLLNFNKSALQCFYTIGISWIFSEKGQSYNTRFTYFNTHIQLGFRMAKSKLCEPS